MKWNAEDIGIYVKAREYVDTIVLPLYPISLDDRSKQTAEMTEFISLLSVLLEKHFKGRLLLLPGLSYLKTADENELFCNLLKWDQEFLDKGFKYIYYLTSDSDWKKIEASLGGSLIWIQAIPLQRMDKTAGNTLLESQVQQLFDIFVNKWQLS